MRSSRQKGQASVEYVAVVALLAVLVGGAAAVVAAPDVPRAVKRTVRQGICIVWGDVCTPADAKARGLDPCVTASTDRRDRHSVTVLSFTVGGTRRFMVERRSDGSYRLTGGDGQDGGAGVGAGFRLGPKLKVSADGTVSAGFETGRTWDFPSKAALDRFLARLDEPDDVSGPFLDALPKGVLQAPSSRFAKGGGGLAGELGVLKASRSLDVRAALGHETSRDGTTWAFDLGGAADVPVLGPGGHLIAEYHRGRHPSLTLRTAGRAGRRVTETVARLPLDDPADRAAAVRYVLAELPDAAHRLAGREVAQRLAARGTVQRFTYRERTAQDGFDVQVQALASIGAAHGVQVVRRELVGAELLTADGVVQRADCLGPGTA